MLTGIPTDWKATHDAFARLQKAEETLRNTYRRTVDGAYGDIAAVTEVLASVDGLIAIRDALSNPIEDPEPEIAAERISEFESDLNALAEIGDIRSPLSAARRALAEAQPDRQEAADRLAEARQAISTEIEWRQPAAAELLPAMGELETMIRDSIGLRQQQRLPRGPALEVASCAAHHRDISLNF